MSVSKFLRDDLSLEVKNWININLVNYLKTNPENYGEIEHIIDFLSSDKAPKRLRKMSYEEAKKGADKWVKALTKKGNNIIETDKDVETIIDFKDGFKLVKLVGNSAFIREGFLMSHCVGSYSNKSNCDIYSLRDIKNNPHCTIEVRKSSRSESIQQIKGKGNGSIHPNYIKYIIQSLKYFDIKINTNEMVNLGYITLQDTTWKILDKTYKEVSYINFNGDKYFYIYSNLL